jgi:GDP-4-dehydro-6-deoxy-D-mannose reductase
LRVLITGASGFAGGYLAGECARAGDEVLGLSRRGTIPADVTAAGRTVDLLDASALRIAIREFRPDVVYHLAALSSVGRSWEDPRQTVQDNVTSAVNVLDAVRHEAPETRLVWVSSCEVYGDPDRLPISENATIRPANPYAVSKAAGEMLAAVYGNAYALRLVRARPFSHAGPGQRDIFIVSSLARQAAEARIAGVDAVQIVTGNPETRRDFTDVRDVARAYRLLAGSADPIADQAIYNVSSGRSISAAEQVQLLGELVAPIRVDHVIDPGRVRASEVMDLRGAHDRLTAATGWQPQIPFRQMLADTIEWWVRELGRSPSGVRH